MNELTLQKQALAADAIIMQIAHVTEMADNVVGVVCAVRCEHSTLTVKHLNTR